MYVNKNFYNGNRISSNLYDTFSYDASNELLGYGNGGTNVGILSYNENGSVVSYEKSGNRFDISYNPLERIEEVSINGNLVSKYTYDPIGERVKKEVYSNGNLEKTVIYFYGQEGLLAEYDENMNLIKKYVWNPDKPWSTDPLYQEDSSGNKYFYINDHLFTPQKIIDENFNTVWQGDYFSFGNVNETVNTVENNLRFPGQYFDYETGFFYNFHRYYAPEIGRYLREDLINKLNLYEYVKSNPVKGFDDKGLVPDWCKCEKDREKWFNKCLCKCFVIWYPHFSCGGYGDILNSFLKYGIGFIPELVDNNVLSYCITYLYFHFYPLNGDDMNIWLAYVFCERSCYDEYMRICHPELNGWWKNWYWNRPW